MGALFHGLSEGCALPCPTLRLRCLGVAGSRQIFDVKSVLPFRVPQPLLGPLLLSLLPPCPSVTPSILRILLGRLGRVIADTSGSKIEAQELRVHHPGIPPISTFTTFVKNKFDTAREKERVIPNFDEVGSQGRTFENAALLLGVFGDGKPAQPGVGKVLHKSVPVGLVDVVRAEDIRHLRNTPHQVNILDLDSLEPRVGLFGIWRSVEPFGRW